ncbi:MAG: DUF86 domain-containing protein [Eubacterium sp.]|nr:DUF86 domain-containing protein [Eubacterium sp.]
MSESISSRDRQILEKILRRIESVMKYTHRYETLEEFKADKMCVEACVFNLLQIGELAKVALSDEVKDRISTVQWKRIYSVKERITIEDAHINKDAVWEVATEKLPILMTEIKNSLK